MTHDIPLLPGLCPIFIHNWGGVVQSGSSQVVLVVKNPPANEGDMRDMGSVPGLRRSPGEGHGTHSSILAWRIPWTEEPGGLQSELQRVGHD